MKLYSIAKRFRIDRPNRFRLAEHNPTECCGLTVEKKEAQAMLAAGIARLTELQERLYANDRWSMLIVLQAMDAGGKDGTIRHVMRGVNPQGCSVTSFKAPTAEELAHDFLWRIHRQVPRFGEMVIFNRSHYEDVLIVRVHKWIDMDECKRRYQHIGGFERALAENGMTILKFFLHISKQEQRERLLSRLDQPEKHWKFSLDDVRERQKWGAYMRAYQEMIRHTATDCAPWYVVPADHKWFARMVVSGAIVQALQALKLDYPKVSGKALKELRKAEKTLKAEK